MHPRLVLALVVIAAAVAAIALPVEVGELLGRPATTSSEMINLRASWGGALLGIGLAIAFGAGGASPQTRGRRVVAWVMWLMVGIGVARAVGFALDGNPDRLQWIWLAAEIVIASGCAWWLRRRPATSRA